MRKFRTLVIAAAMSIVLAMTGCSGSGASDAGVSSGSEVSDSSGGGEDTDIDKINEDKADSSTDNVNVGGDDTTSDTTTDDTENDDESGGKAGDESSEAVDESNENTAEETTESQYKIPEINVERYDVPDTESMRFAEGLTLGVSLGNTFDAYKDSNLEDEMDTETVWQSVVTTQEIIEGYHDAGFTTIRIPVSWHNHVSGDDFTISEQWMDRIQEVVDWAIDDGMYVIINIHHDNHPEANAYYPNSEHLDQSIKYVTSIWTQVSERFKDYDEHLIFESLNEPRLVDHDNEWFIQGNDDCKDSIECINVLNQTIVDTIRASGGNNASRYIMVPGYDASSKGALNSGFVFPTDPVDNDHRIMLSIHEYTPYSFALEYPGEDIFNYKSESSTGDIDEFMDSLYESFISQGIPVVIGEFGAVDKSQNTQSRVNFASYYVASARARGMTCMWWDNNSFQSNGLGLYYRRGGYLVYPDIMNAMLQYCTYDAE